MGCADRQKSVKNETGDKHGKKETKGTPVSSPRGVQRERGGCGDKGEEGHEKQFAALLRKR